MELTVNVTAENENQVVIAIEGEIDAHTAPQLREELFGVDLGKVKEAVLDMSNVGYMDSTGIGVIVAFYKNGIAKDSEVKLVGLSPRLKRLFDITGLSGIIHVEEA